MNQETLIGDFAERLRERLDELLPRQSVDAAVEQARRALRQGFAELDLVPRRELDGHLAALEELRRTVEDLEQRIRALERG